MTYLLKYRKSWNSKKIFKNLRIIRNNNNINNKKRQQYYFPVQNVSRGQRFFETHLFLVNILNSLYFSFGLLFTLEAAGQTCFWEREFWFRFFVSSLSRLSECLVRVSTTFKNTITIVYIITMKINIITTR